MCDRWSDTLRGCDSGVGDVRVILRPLSSDERRQVNVDAPAYLVERVIDRRDLERAADSLR